MRGGSADPVPSAFRSTVRLKNGSLPHLGRKVCGGAGSGKACAVSDQPIWESQVEYER